MSGTERVPPAVARRLLERAAERLGTPELVDDAAELFAEKAARDGVQAARRWYRRQLRAALVRIALPRARVRWTAPSLRSLAGLSLDARLGMRMLVRYPGLTIVGALAMAFAIFVGAGTFEFITQNLDPRLPLPDGDRIVGLRYWDRAANEESLPLPEDLRTWREQLDTIDHLGGFQTLERSLFVDEAGGEPVLVARMSVVAFRLAGVPPLLGRVLVEEDERAGAPPVVVVGYRLWQSRFAGDVGAIGRPVRLGETEATVVGVMPEGFGFPSNHNVWTPLRLDDLASRTDSGARLRVFGRLAGRATLEEARAEANALAARGAREQPSRFEHLNPQVLPYAHSLFSRNIGLRLRALVYQLNVYAALFLTLVCANISLLMFARAAAREREILVRTALGASRRRLVMQFFVEALVLGALAGVLGLAAAAPGLRWLYQRLRELAGQELPFWLVPGVSPTTVSYVALLTVFAAVVTGVLPALKVTRRTATSGGPRLGGIWTGVIVVQIAASVVFTAGAWLIVRQAWQGASIQTNFPGEQYVGLRLEMHGENERDTNTSDSRFRERYAARLRELQRRIAEHPGVARVTAAERLPVAGHPSRLVELDARREVPDLEPGFAVCPVSVDLDFFTAFGAPVIAGRGFESGDLHADGKRVVVDQLFVDEVLGGQNPVGQRIRYVDAGRRGEPGPWHEIIGVVRNLVVESRQTLNLDSPPQPRIYHALDPGRATVYPVHIAVHVRTSPESLASSIHRIAAAVSPTLRVHDVRTLDRYRADEASLWKLWAQLVSLVSATSLFLSLAAIYAVMSFTVARRRREIGVRVALGAKTARIIADTFRKPLVHVLLGVTAGCLLVSVLVPGFVASGVTIADGALLLAYGAAMIAVCALACIGPTLRALRVAPAEALSAPE